MDDPTSLLCCLNGFRVVDVVRVDDRVLQIVIETVEVSQACPECGARSSRRATANCSGDRVVTTSTTSRAAA
jgi:hypothetical protein